MLSGSFARMSAAAVLLGISLSSALAAEYRDPKGAFSISYDENVWSLDMDKNGDFGLECKEPACKGMVAACTTIKEPVPGGSVKSIMAVINGEDLASVQLKAFVEVKTDIEKKPVALLTGAKAKKNVPPTVVKAYAPRQIAGHPFLQAEFRFSILGETMRYVSYMTAGPENVLGVMCHSTETGAAEWRPRFEALMVTFRAPASN